MHNRLSPSLISLLIANIAVIVIALIEQWPAPVLLWTYWLQSIIVGFFQALKMAELKTFSTENLTFNNQPLAATPASKQKIIIFFAFHYSFFHLIYAIFLAQFFRINDANGWQIILLPSAIFLINHALSFFLNRPADQKRLLNIGQLMFAPYQRIVPMHLVLIFGALFFGNTTVLIFFLLLKTAMDLVMHWLEHKKEGQV